MKPQDGPVLLDHIETGNVLAQSPVETSLVDAERAPQTPDKVFIVSGEERSEEIVVDSNICSSVNNVRSQDWGPTQNAVQLQSTMHDKDNIIPQRIKEVFKNHV